MEALAKRIDRNIVLSSNFPRIMRSTSEDAVLASFYLLMQLFSILERTILADPEHLPLFVELVTRVDIFYCEFRCNDRSFDQQRLRLLFVETRK